MAQKWIRETAKPRRRAVEIAEGQFLIVEDHPDFVDPDERDEHQNKLADDMQAILDEIDESQEEFAEEVVIGIEASLGNQTLLAQLAAERDELAHIAARNALHASRIMMS